MTFMPRKYSIELNLNIKKDILQHHFLINPFIIDNYHVLWQLVARQIFDILMLRVNNLGQLLPIDHFFINPHVHHWVKPV